MGANGTQKTNDNSKEETGSAGKRHTEPGNNRPQSTTGRDDDLGNDGTMRDQGNDQGRIGTPAGKAGSGR